MVCTVLVHDNILNNWIAESHVFVKSATRQCDDLNCRWFLPHSGKAALKSVDGRYQRHSPQFFLSWKDGS